MSFRKNILFSTLSLVFVWLLWLIVYAILRNDYILPSFWETMRSTGSILGEAEFWQAFFRTLGRVFVAFLISMVLGAGLALLSGLHPFVRSFFSPIVSILRTVPTMAIILMLLFWTNPRVAPVIVSLLVLMPAFYAATLSAIDEVKERYGGFARAFGVNAGRKIMKMYLPLAGPAVLSQAGAIFSMGLKITISGEVLCNTFQSIGGLMQEAKMFLEMPMLMALTLISILMGFLFEGLGVLFYRLSVRWRQ